MSALALMRDLQAAGVILEEREGRLRVNAPAGFLTTEVRDSLAQHKRELLAMLAADPAECKNPAPLDDVAPWAADPAERRNWIRAAERWRARAVPAARRRRACPLAAL